MEVTKDQRDLVFSAVWDEQRAYSVWWIGKLHQLVPLGHSAYVGCHLDGAQRTKLWYDLL